MKYPAWLFTVALCGLSACDVYDPSLVRIHRGDLGVAGGTAGTDAGSNGGGFGAAGGPPVSPSGDDDAGVTGPDGTGPRCGNGRVDDGERCDTGIASGTPGSCPITCETTGSCQRVMVVGFGCQTQCQLITLGCTGGDGCCPSDCDPKQDSDCSGMCGDGIVQSELGETCENSDPTETCPTSSSCADDDACTRDALSGSAENCNAACTHTKITGLQNDDGCCPAGADANSDNDCMPRCGNGVREGTEACDGSTGCDASCKLTLTSTQVMCLDTIAKNDCERCACKQCAEAVMACSSSGNAARDAKCTAVEACAIEKNCAGTACYCGTSTYIECAFAANGPCKDVIEDAAGTTNPNSIQSQTADPNTTLGRAMTLGDCRRAQCNGECS